MSFFLKAQSFVIKNAPTILSIAGAIGTIAAVASSANSSLKAQHMLENAEFKARNKELCDKYLSEETKANDICPFNELLNEMLENGMTADDIKEAISKCQQELPAISTGDKLLILAKAYGPTIALTAASIACIIGSNHISNRRIAYLAAAYLASESTNKEYKDKIKGLLGEKKAQEINDEFVQDRIKKTVGFNDAELNTKDTIMNLPNLSLWYDVYSDRYFYSNAEMIRRAELDAQRLLEKNGSVNLNDIYGFLSLKEIPCGNHVGWFKKRPDDPVEVRIKIGGALDDEDHPIGTIEVFGMNVDPVPDNTWCSI